jgi:hypothetical protein
MPRIVLDGVAAMADPLDPMNEHATLIGSVVIAYNKIHWVISVLFVAFSGMPTEEARDVFFALKSDRLQRDITLAAGKTALAEHPALWERFETTLEKVNELAGERNAAVHTMWAIDWQYWGVPSLYFPKVGVASEAILHEKLKDDFPAQFAELNQKLQEHFVELDRIRGEYEKLTA